MHNTATLRRSLLLLTGAVMLLVGVLLALQPWQLPVLFVEDGPEDAIEGEQSESVGVEAQSVEPEPEPQPLNFTISAGGDMLIHMPVADSAWDGTRWDFSRLMEPVTPYIQGSDIALCNMETAMVPRDQDPTGYPIFGTPRDLADEMAEMGWTGCSTSSNHSLDQGFAGVVNTLDFLDAAGLGHAGTARSQEEANQPQFYSIEGGDQSIKVAHIAAAHNTNGLPIPEEAPWSIQMIDVPQIEAQARQARENGADIVVATLHCCEAEYNTAAEPFQEQTAAELAASGLIDIYIAHHAHVPRPIALLEGGPNGNGMWVAYGLGNFISNQTREATGSTESSTGLMAFFEGVKDEGEPAQIVAAEWLAVTVDAGHIVRPLIGGVAENAALPQEEMSYRWDLTRQILEGGPATEITSPPTSDSNLTTVIKRS
ncbi:CapA family protein [Actinomyces minihominis]|uniref:CapA family protein n=1 Tax=Actinomyces minihominis TaxID=2002838 RepID=UPI000C0888A2|nr:CapA family protein [Actinomyces minihominis]